MLFRPKPNDANPQERAVWGSLMSLGLNFPIAILLGFFIGRWIGGKFGYETEGKYIGLAWGVAAAFYELYKVSKRMIKQDEDDQKRALGSNPDTTQKPSDPDESSKNAGE